MGLFKPAWMSVDVVKALKAVEKETDQKKLAEIANLAPNSDVRYKAIEKLTDQSVIIDFVRASKRHIDSARDKLALGKLTEANLAKIVVNSGDGGVFIANTAFEGISNEPILADIAKRSLDSTRHIAIKAVTRISSDNILADLVTSSAHSEVCCMAIKKMRDESALLKASLGAHHADTAICAINRINSVALLKEYINKTEGWYSTPMRENNPHLVAVDRLKRLSNTN